MFLATIWATLLSPVKRKQYYLEASESNENSKLFEQGLKYYIVERYEKNIVCNRKL